MADLIVAHGYVVTLDPERRVIEDGAVEVRGRDIIAVGASDDLLAAHAGEIIDAGGGLVLPGLIDAHNHPVQGIYQGGSPAELGNWPATRSNNPFTLGGDITTLINYLATPFGSRLSEEEAYLSALYTFAGHLKTGVTCIHDGGGAHAGAVARAASDCGIRAIITRQSGDLTIGAGDAIRRYADVDDELQAMEALIQELHGSSSGRLRVWANLLYAVACSDELCVGMKALADRYDTGVNSHFAALPNEAAFSMRHFGILPIERLAAIGVLGPNVQGIHVGQASDAEIEMLARHDVKVAHCPSSSSFAAHGCISGGQFPKMAQAGVTIGLGIDGGSDMFYQLAAASSFHKDMTLDLSVFDAPAVIETATIQGARSCCWDAEIGSLEVGKRADLIIVDRSGWHWLPEREPVRAFVESGQRSDIQTVVVDGEVLLRDRAFTQLDEERLRYDVREAARAVYGRG